MKPLNTKETSRLVSKAEFIDKVAWFFDMEYFLHLNNGDICLLWIDVANSVNLARLRLIRRVHGGVEFDILEIYDSEEDYNAVVSYNKLFGDGRSA